VQVPTPPEESQLSAVQGLKSLQVGAPPPQVVPIGPEQNSPVVQGSPSSQEKPPSGEWEQVPVAPAPHESEVQELPSSQFSVLMVTHISAELH
jgi:hypothetical protein